MNRKFLQVKDQSTDMYALVVVKNLNSERYNISFLFSCFSPFLPAHFNFSCTAPH